MPDVDKIPQIIVCNSGPLIALSCIDCLELLHDIYEKVLIPNAVFREVTSSLSLPGALNIAACSWICREEINTSLDRLLISELGSGESEVIVLALEKQTQRVLIDERKARRIAELVYGLTVTGTGGILLRAKKEGFVDAVLPLLREMRRNGYYLSERLVERIAEEAGESAI